MHDYMQLTLAATQIVIAITQVVIVIELRRLL